MLVTIQVLACLNLLCLGMREHLSPFYDKHCPSGLAQASKKIKQCCNSFEEFWEEKPTPGCFLALSRSDAHPCSYWSQKFVGCGLWWSFQLMLLVLIPERAWLLKAHQEKSRRTRHLRTIQWRSCSKSVLRARQKRLVLSYKQPPAHPG